MQPRVVDGEFDYICFTDGDLNADAGVWKLCPIPYTKKNDTRAARHVKLQPDKVLSEYEYSVWIDANVCILDREFYDAVNCKISSGCVVAHLPHPIRDCTYEEVLRCFHDYRIGFLQAVRQILHLKKEGFPQHYGLYENNVLFRKHNDPTVVRLSAAWWDELLKYTPRDQLSVMYVYWKNGFSPELLLGEGVNARNSDCLKCEPHNILYVKGGKLKEALRLIKRSVGLFLLKKMI